MSATYDAETSWSPGSQPRRPDLFNKMSAPRAERRGRSTAAPHMLVALIICQCFQTVEAGMLPESFVTGYRNASFVWASALLFFSLVIVLHGIGQQWNNPAWKPNQEKGSHPVLEIVFFLFMLTWISLLEGCQISIVGLQGIDLETYKDSHPRAYKALKLAFKGPNVERFLVGRQFLLLSTASCAAASAAPRPSWRTTATTRSATGSGTTWGPAPRSSGATASC
jgi:hypothetical protein